MKKALLLLSLLLIFALVGCNKANDTNTPEVNSEKNMGENNESTPTEESFFFLFKDTEIRINDDILTVTEALGEPTSYFESNSCAFQGLDKVYTYGSVIIRTYPKDGKDYVLSIELRDDSVATPEGVSIGNTLEFAESIYGKPDEKTSTSLIYRKGDSALNFISKNDEIFSITYTAGQ